MQKFDTERFYLKNLNDTLRNSIGSKYKNTLAALENLDDNVHTKWAWRNIKENY
jgi:hypothetical protein